MVRNRFSQEHRIDLAGILADRSPRRIVLDGWFQRHEYYRPHRAKIREWFTFCPSIHVPDAKPDVVVNVRRTDYVQLGWRFHFRITRKRWNGCCPTAEDYGSRPTIGGSFFSKLRALAPTLFVWHRARANAFHGESVSVSDVAEHVQLVANILGQSTGSGLSTAVVRRVVGAGEARDANLIERDRFMCIECREPYQPTIAEARHKSGAHCGGAWYWRSPAVPSLAARVTALRRTFHASSRLS